MKYLRYFPDSQIIGGGVKVDLPNISYLEGKNTLFVPGHEGQATVVYNSNTGEIEVENASYASQYFTMEAVKPCTFTFHLGGNISVSDCEYVAYSTDDGISWVTTNNNGDGNTKSITTPTIPAGGKVVWKGIARAFSNDVSVRHAWDSNPPVDCCFIEGSDDFIIYGNIMSLLYGDNFENQTTLTAPRTFKHLFNSQYRTHNLISAENLILPATTLTNECYNAMFQFCSKLTTAPELPATTLPTISGYTEGCYGFMFLDCTNLNYIKMLATNVSESSALNGWVGNVSSTGTFVKTAGVTIPTGTNGIPSGWAVVDA